jgi:ABC-type nitrate/sulfonate/bicarbonate transport system substrate-binding protein
MHASGRPSRREVIASIVALGAVTTAPVRRVSAATAKYTVKVAINPNVYGYLPIMYGIDQGYFADEGIEVAVTHFNASSVTQLPSLVKGDLNIASGVPAPALFNQVGQGWDIKAFATTSAARAGWHDELWVMVRKDLWDSGAVRKLSDVRGRRIDAATPGAPINLLVNELLLRAGLSRSDVIYTERLHDQVSMFSALRNQAVDFVAVVEPTASQMVESGIGMRFASNQDVAPNAQTAFLIASSKYLAENKDAVSGFLRVCMRSREELMKSGPRAFPPAAQKVLASWTQRPEDEVAKLAPPYFVVEEVRPESLGVPEDFWISEGLVKTKVSPSDLIDNSFISLARKRR